MLKDDARRVTLGKLTGVFGVQGWVRLHSDTRPLENIFKYKRWWIAREGGQGFEAKLLKSQVLGNGLVAQITGPDGLAISDRDVAAALHGSLIQVEKAKLPKLPKGQHYWIDLIGLEVKNLEGVALGKVSDMTSNGAQDVMVLQDGEVERMIPFVSGPIVKSVDVAAGVIVCDWQPDY